MRHQPVWSPGFSFFGELGADDRLRQVQRLREDAGQLVEIFNQRTVRHDRFHRFILGQRHAIHIEDGTPPRVDRLGVNVLLCGLRLVVIVAGDLQVDEPEGKGGKADAQADARRESPLRDGEAHGVAFPLETGRTVFTAPP